MANITFIGMGSMGSRMALNLIKAGHNVCVWNRSVDRTTSLIKAGARAENSPCEAVKDADVVISMLRDDEASKKAWCDETTGALASMVPGAIAMECSTLSVNWVQELNQHCAKRNIAFLDAPVAGSRPQADAVQLIFFVGGDSSEFEAVQPILKNMGGIIHHAGSTGAGTTIKLAVNALFGIQLAAMAELIGLFNASKIDTRHAVEILTSTPVCSPAANAAATAMLSGEFPPMFPINLVEKDFSYAIATTVDNGASTPITKSTHRVFQQALQKGFGNDNITGIVQLYR